MDNVNEKIVALRRRVDDQAQSLEGVGSLRLSVEQLAQRHQELASSSLKQELVVVEVTQRLKTVVVEFLPQLTQQVCVCGGFVCVCVCLWGFCVCLCVCFVTLCACVEVRARA